MDSLARTIGITIACAVVILASNVVIYASQPPKEPPVTHDEQASLRVVMHFGG